MFIIALVGAGTALFAATIGLAQWDIKKVLAYSTISQLGYMFLACGVGAFSAGIFHVFTHAFFKALLFLGAGSVLIALHHEQDMRRMGGLKRYLPATFWTMIFGWLAIAGVPLLSGFFSKDAILYSALKSDGLFPEPWPGVLWVVGVITALVTAIYMTRLMVLTFWGDERFRGTGHADESAGDTASDHQGASGAEAHEHTPRESPPSMVIPLAVLAVGAIFAGYLNVPSDFGAGKFARIFDELLEPALSHPIAEVSRTTAEHGAGFLNSELGLAVISSGVAILGIFIGWVWFRRQPLWQPPRLLEEKYRIDELYNKTIVQPVKIISTAVLWRIVDNGIIDGVVNGSAAVARLVGRGLGRLQSGLARAYVATIVLGALLIIGYFVIAR
jgi:NADH-quinone oxidoreductase subunit L